jgi:hypothetical protein
MRTDKNLAADIADLKAQLADVTLALARLVKLADEGDAASFSITQFCKRHHLPESQYHKLRSEGRGPRTMRTGSVGVRISREAEADWIAAREAETAEAPKRTVGKPRSATVNNTA